MSNTVKYSKTRILTECAICIALATVLSLISIFRLPLGGKITLFSMLPICVISLRHGIRYGLFSSFIFSLIQLGIDFSSLMSWGLTREILIASVFFDYIIAFTVLGLASIFGRNSISSAVLGTVFVIFLRFISHVISGSVFFAEFMPEGWANPFIYSVCYNGAFILPEMAMTAIATPFVLTALKKADKK